MSPEALRKELKASQREGISGNPQKTGLVFLGFSRSERKYGCHR